MHLKALVLQSVVAKGPSLPFDILAGDLEGLFQPCEVRCHNGRYIQMKAAHLRKIRFPPLEHIRIEETQLLSHMWPLFLEV